MGGDAAAWLLAVAEYADAYRAICAGGVDVRSGRGSDYDHAAAKLDGALNELRIAREAAAMPSNGTSDLMTKPVKEHGKPR